MGFLPISAEPYAEDFLLNAWDRLLAIGSLYPADNDRFLSSLEEWRGALCNLELSKTVELEIGSDFRLAHCGQVHDPDRVGRSRLYPILMSIGIEGLRLSKEIEAEALHLLLRLLQKTAQTAERSRGFQHADLADLPAGVELRLRRFSAGERKADSEWADADGFKVELRDETPETPEPSVEFDGEDLFNPHLGGSSPVARTIEDQLRSSAMELHRDLIRQSERSPVPSDLKALDLDDELLPAVDLSAGALGSAPEKAEPLPSPAAGESPVPDEFGMEALQSCLDKGDLPFTATEGVAGEWISLLIQLFLDEREALDSDLLIAELKTALSDMPDLQVVQVLLSALEDLLASGDAARVDRLFPPAFGLLRGHPDLQAQLLIELNSGVGMQGQEMLWPHLTNELLRGAPELLAQFREDGSGSVLRLAPELWDRVLPRMEACPAMVEGHLNPTLFQPRRRTFAPLYLMLLRSVHAETAGGLLHRSFRKHPPPEPYASLLTLLGGFRISHRELYRLLIRVEGLPSLKADLGLECAELARVELERLPKASRRNPEVLQAIALLAPASSVPTDELLTRIRRQRRLGLFPTWPAAARRVAERVAARRSRASERGDES